MKVKTGMTEDRLLKLLRDAHPTEGGEGLRTDELVAQLKLNMDTVRERLRELLTLGKVRLGKRVITTLNGTRRSVVTYVFVDGKKK